jgi:hypothetical protein
MGWILGHDSRSWEIPPCSPKHPFSKYTSLNENDGLLFPAGELSDRNCVHGDAACETTRDAPGAAGAAGGAAMFSG